MAIRKEIEAKYKELHDMLSATYYDFHNLSKRAFDSQHGLIWRNMEAELIGEGYKQPPEPIRDLIAEVDELKDKVELLENPIAERL